jgi:excisionase family DNA binding protein
MDPRTDTPLEKPIAYRVDEAARVSGLSRSTLYALRAKGQLAFKRVAGRSLILRRDLEALIEGAHNG